MPRLLLLLPALTYRAEAFLKAAQKINVNLTVGSEDPVHPFGPAFSNWLRLDFSNLEATTAVAVEFAKTNPIDAVVGVNDNTTVFAAMISEALSLPHNSVSSVLAARNKHRMRQTLKRHGLPTPQFSVCAIDENPEVVLPRLNFPCVVKPLTLSASCGVIRVDDPQGFREAFARVRTLLKKLGLQDREEAGRQILIEDFLPGVEVALEGLLTNGALRVLAIFDKPDPLDGPFFEETIYVTPSRFPPETQNQIGETLAQAALALGLREGPIHGELRINQKGIWVIEVAARSIGGRCSQTLRFSTGLSLEELILRHALRMDLSNLEREAKPAGVMMLPIRQGGILERIEGQEKAFKVAGIEELTITAQPGDLLVPLPEGTRYLGFLVARGESPEEVELALREAHRHLHVVVSPASPERQSSTPRFGIIQV